MTEVKQKQLSLKFVSVKYLFYNEERIVLNKEVLLFCQYIYINYFHFVSNGCGIPLNVQLAAWSDLICSMLVRMLQRLFFYAECLF